MTCRSTISIKRSHITLMVILLHVIVELANRQMHVLGQSQPGFRETTKYEKKKDFNSLLENLYTFQTSEYLCYGFYPFNLIM